MLRKFKGKTEKTVKKTDPKAVACKRCIFYVVVISKVTHAEIVN